MSCKECKYSPQSFTEYCIAQSNTSMYCPDAYTEKSHLCNNYDINNIYKVERNEENE